MEFPFLDPLIGGEVACEHRAGEGFLPNLRGLVPLCLVLQECETTLGKAALGAELCARVCL